LNILNSIVSFAILLGLRLGRISYRLWRWIGRLQQREPRSWTPPPGGVETVAIENANDLTQDEFIRKYLRPNRPVILRGAMGDWRALKEWSPEFFVEHFGDIRVKVQDSFFDSIGKMDMRTYFTEIWPKFASTETSLTEKLDTLVDHPGSTDADSKVMEDFVTASKTTVPSAPNTRYQQPSGYLAEFQRCFGLISEQQAKDFFSCAAYLKLNEHWTTPKCFPTSGYCFPFTLFKPEQPNERWFYDFGIYTSPRGTLTRMHIDGSRTHAVLCLLSGQKKCILLPPSTAYCFQSAYDDDHLLQHIGEPCFRDCPQRMKDQLPMQALECTLNAGEVLFVPKCWMHEVHTTESSIMLTFNFLHGLPDLAGTFWQHLWLGWGGGMFLNKV